MANSLRGLCRVAAALAALICGSALAQDTYPSRPVQIVVSYPPGGAVDTGIGGVGRGGDDEKRNDGSHGVSSQEWIAARIASPASP